MPDVDPGPRESDLIKRVRAVAHVDDRIRRDEYIRILRSAEEPAGAVETRLADMLFFRCSPTAVATRTPRTHSGLCGTNQSSMNCVR